MIPLLAVLLTAHGAEAQQRPLPPLQPITEPPSGEYLYGKFVWADLFASDVAAARAFYEQLFGWEWLEIKPPPEPYGMFYVHGQAVAGLAQRHPPEGTGPYGRWIHYISVTDVARAEALTVERGGRSLLSRIGTYPERGDFAIVADPGGALVGLMRSSSGDPPDYRAEPGEWIWRSLYTLQAEPSAEFYSDLAGYEYDEDEETPDVLEYRLATHGYARAGIADLPDDAEEGPTWLGFIRVDDIGHTLARAAELGGEVLMAPRVDMLDGDLAIIADPVGGLIGLIRWTYPEEEEATP